MTNEQTIVMLTDIKDTLDNAIENFKNENQDNYKQGTFGKYYDLPCLEPFEELSEKLFQAIKLLGKK